MPRGGARKGAGRRPNGTVAGISHVRRTVPVGKKIRVGIRLRSTYPGWRDRRLKKIADAAVEVLGGCVGIRVSESWVADRMLWMVVEASGAETLSRGMQGFGVRVAKRVQAKFRTRGGVLGDRYELRAPVEKKWRERVDGAVRGTAKALWNAAGVVKNEWMDPEKRNAALERGPPLVALGKAAGLFALAVITARPGPSFLLGTGNRSERIKAEIKRENEHIRQWRWDRERELARQDTIDDNRRFRARRWWNAWEIEQQQTTDRDWGDIHAEREAGEKLEHEQIEDGTWKSRRKKRAKKRAQTR
jgi:hypothetical protein